MKIMTNGGGTVRTEEITPSAEQQIDAARIEEVSAKMWAIVYGEQTTVTTSVLLHVLGMVITLHAREPQAAARAVGEMLQLHVKNYVAAGARERVFPASNGR